MPDDTMDGAPLLEVMNLDAFYGDFQALFDISISLEAGEVLAIVGANGAGKSTLLKAIVGQIAARPKTIRLCGSSIGGSRPFVTAAHGIALVPEGRRLFASLTVEENLLIGGQVRRPGPWNLERVYELFPALFDHRGRPATALSGGQQQMVAIGRALMSNPDLLLCDELSLGLAPIVVRDIYARIPVIVATGTALVIVEQNLDQALAVADAVACLQEGRIVLQGRRAEVSRDAIAAAYFGA
jgi:branched-chain amino acid transport system ATP-binding protein